MPITIGDVLYHIRADDKGLPGDLKRSESTIQRWANATGGMIQNALSTAIGIGIAQVGGLIVGGLGRAAVAVKSFAIDTNASLEQSRISFTQLLGSVKEADIFIRAMAQFAARTPFSFEAVQDGAIKFMNMGLAAKDVLPLLTAVGDAVAAVGGSSAQVERVNLALAQMMARGKVSAGEINQLAEAQIPGWDILAQKLGKTRGEVIQLAEQGKISSEVFIQAFKEYSQLNFGGAMEKQSRTFSGAVSTIMDSLQMLTAGALRPVFDLATKVAVRMSDFLQSKEVEAAASLIADALTAMLGDTDAAINGFIKNLSGMGTWAFNIASAFVDGFAAGMQGIVAVLNAVTSVIASFLMGFSPPKAGPLKEIDRGGTNVALAWLRGLTKADLSIVSDWAGRVERILREDVLNKAIPVDLFGFAAAQARAYFAVALDEIRRYGTASDETMRNIASVARDATDQIMEQVRAYGAVMRQQDLLRIEEDRLRLLRDQLDAIREQHAVRRDAIREEREGFDERRQDIRDQLDDLRDHEDDLREQLRQASPQGSNPRGNRAAIEGQIMAVEAQRRALERQMRDVDKELRGRERVWREEEKQMRQAESTAQKQVDAQDKIVQAQRQKVEAAQAELDTIIALHAEHDKITEAYKEQARLAKQLADEAERAAKGAAGGGGGGSGGKAGGLAAALAGAAGGAARGLSEEMRAAAQQAQAELEAAKKQLQTRLQEMAQPWIDLKDKITDSLDKAKTAFNDFVIQVLFLVIDVKNAVNSLKTTFETNGLEGILVRLFGKEPVENAKNLALEVKDKLNPALIELGLILTGVAFAVALPAITANVKELAASITKVTSALMPFNAAWMAAAAPIIFFSGIFNNLAHIWNQDWFGMRTTWDQKALPIFEGLKQWFTVDLPSAFNQQKQNQDDLKKNSDTNTDGMATGWENAKRRIGEVLTILLQWLDPRDSAVAKRTTALVDMFKNLLGQLVGIVRDAVNEIVRQFSRLPFPTMAVPGSVGIPPTGPYNPQSQAGATSSGGSIGSSINEGIGQGIDDSSYIPRQALERTLDDTIQHGMDVLRAQSPSQEAADRIGAPIGQGVARGILGQAAYIASSLQHVLTGALKDAHRSLPGDLSSFQADLAGGLAATGGLQGLLAACAQGLQPQTAGATRLQAESERATSQAQSAGPKLVSAFITAAEQEIDAQIASPTVRARLIQLFDRLVDRSIAGALDAFLATQPDD